MHEMQIHIDPLRDINFIYAYRLDDCGQLETLNVFKEEHVNIKCLKAAKNETRELLKTPE